jgi:hypothetical protein
MANYVKATNFTAKDSLLSGDSGKIIKGAEIDTEFTAIASAVASKANTNSPAFTGTPTAPTATSGTNTTQVATTAFVTAALAAVYPVGSIYINATSASNPNTLLGFGTWTAFGAGRVMVGLDASDALFDTAEETGGSKDAVVVSHTHTATVTDPQHAHSYTASANLGEGVSLNGYMGGISSKSYTTGSASTGISVTNASSGVSGTNANVQPFIVVKMWKRTA